jgi:hypothetical protein
MERRIGKRIEWSPPTDRECTRAENRRQRSGNPIEGVFNGKRVHGQVGAAGEDRSAAAVYGAAPIILRSQAHAAMSHPAAYLPCHHCAGRLGEEGKMTAHRSLQGRTTVTRRHLRLGLGGRKTGLQFFNQSSPRVAFCACVLT